MYFPNVFSELHRFISEIVCNFISIRVLSTRAPPGQSDIYDLGRRREEEEEENDPPIEAIIIPTDSEGKLTSLSAQLLEIQLFKCVPKSIVSLFISAYLNVNTNATTRGDAQVSKHFYQM